MKLVYIAPPYTLATFKERIPLATGPWEVVEYPLRNTHSRCLVIRRPEE